MQQSPGLVGGHGLAGGGFTGFAAPNNNNQFTGGFWSTSQTATPSSSTLASTVVR